MARLTEPLVRSYCRWQIYLFLLFDVKKKVEVSFTAPDMTNLDGLPVLCRVMRDDDFLNRFSRRFKDWRNPDFFLPDSDELLPVLMLLPAIPYAPLAHVLKNFEYIFLAVIGLRDIE